MIASTVILPMRLDLFHNNKDESVFQEHHDYLFSPNYTFMKSYWAKVEQFWSFLWKICGYDQICSIFEINSNCDRCDNEIKSKLLAYKIQDLSFFQLLIIWLLRITPLMNQMGLHQLKFSKGWWYNNFRSLSKASNIYTCFFNDQRFKGIQWSVEKSYWWFLAQMVHQ